MPQELKTVQEFTDTITGDNLTIVHFSAKWADQSQHLNDVLDELAKQTEYQNAGIQFCSCEAEDLTELSLQYEIIAAPTVLLFQKGKILDRIEGVDIAQLTAKVKQYAGSSRGQNKGNLEERLKKLINRHNVVIFMKGDRNTPRCGFSKKLIEIVNDLGVDYDTFDILQDEEVRQGLKKFSDWPTYPQVYVKGELIGGLDIIKEMQAGGELESTLKG